MKICTIIPSLFILLCIINSSSAYSCNTTSCPRSLNSSIYTTEVPVQSPFRLNRMQAKSCGYEGFDLYCDNTLGTLIEFSDDLVLHVDEINYYSNLLILSDPYDHFLIQKLLTLDLTDTLFYPANASALIYSQEFWVYSCSIFDSYADHLYDRLDCLNGSDYTLISAKFDTTGVPNSNSCTFLKILTVSTPYTRTSTSSHNSHLCTLSKIALTWSGFQEVPPAYSREPQKSYYTLPSGVLAPLAGAVIPIITILLCYCRFCRNARANTSTTNNQSRALGTATWTVTGLDQVTIDSYPVVVVGASGRLIRPDNATCSICLSDYCPQETLKILPECLHRFHVDCIDEWLRSKGVCPICRISTPHNSSNH